MNSGTCSKPSYYGFKESSSRNERVTLETTDYPAHLRFKRAPLKSAAPYPTETRRNDVTFDSPASNNNPCPIPASPPARRYRYLIPLVSLSSERCLICWPVRSCTCPCALARLHICASVWASAPLNCIAARCIRCSSSASPVAAIDCSRSEVYAFRSCFKEVSGNPLSRTN